MNEKKMRRREKIRRTVALIGVILLAGMILATFVVACINFEGSTRIFLGLLSCDIAIPIMLWIYLSIYKMAVKADDRMNEEANTDTVSSGTEADIANEKTEADLADGKAEKSISGNEGK